jgi:hypothetical protein
VGNYNVICVDWKQYSTDLSYAIAKARAKHIGKDIARVVSRITKNMTEGTADMHLIGHSLGAHIVGFTGKILTNLVPRITGNSNTIYIINGMYISNFKFYSITNSLYMKNIMKIYE